MDEDKSKRELKITHPPILGFPTKPPVVEEPPPRSGQKCSNCNAFAIVPHPVLGQQTVCRAEPVQPVFLGFQPTKTVNAQGQPGQFPFIMGIQAPTDPENGWCRCWQWVGPDGGQ